MTAEPTTNGVLLDEPHYEDYEPVPQETDLTLDQPVEQYEEPAADPTITQTDQAPTETPKITQAAAMRQALADLGLGAKNGDLAHYLRTKFGMEPKNIAVLKSAAKKALFQKQPAEERPSLALTAPETDPQQEQNPATEAQPLAQAEVRSPDVQQEPQEPKLADVEAPVQHLPGTTGNRLVLIKPDQPRQPSHVPATEPTFSIEEVQAVKRLCDRLGAETLLELIDILGY